MGKRKEREKGVGKVKGKRSNRGQGKGAEKIEMSGLAGGAAC